MINRMRSPSSAWMTLSAILAVNGTLRVLDGAPHDTAYVTKSIVSLFIGVALFFYARWLQRREYDAIARGSMAPDKELT
jgi:hypothetical protein